MNRCIAFACVLTVGVLATTAYAVFPRSRCVPSDTNCGHNDYNSEPGQEKGCDNHKPSVQKPTTCPTPENGCTTCTDSEVQASFCAHAYEGLECDDNGSTTNCRTKLTGICELVVDTGEGGTFYYCDCNAGALSGDCTIYLCDYQN